ncbi:MAG: DNRLRE domain-containing protein [Chloroflexota bacterium]|nr:DNRLRE domain-containing protein [Chloroflexota bacterium]
MASWTATPGALASHHWRTPADDPSDLLFSTFLGGSNSDSGSSIAVDSAGSIYMTGETWSANFPTTPTQQTVTLTSVSDATILEGYPFLNFGEVIDIWVGYDDYSNPNGEIARGLVKFDLSSFPNRADIQNGTLRIYYKGHWEFPDWVDTITAFQAQGNWQEMSVTWNNKPGFGNSYGSVDVVADGNWRWYELDVKSLVQDWVNGTYPNEGIVLRGEEASGAESSWRAFYTREGNNPPELVVTYSSAANTQLMCSTAPDASNAQSTSIMKRLNASRFDSDGPRRQHQSVK